MRYLQAMAGLVVAYNGATAGLGNRIRVTLGSWNLARHTDRRFAYVWPRGSAFGPRLSDLWDWREGTIINRAVSRSLALVTSYYGADVGKILQDSRHIWQIRTGGPLILPDGVEPWQSTFRSLTPAPSIAREITRTFDSHFRGQRYIGVMIRVHEASPTRTKAVSTVEWYEQRMKQILEQDSEVSFFISCDVPEVKMDILRTFPNATAIAHSHEYNSTPAVQAAVADLYLLAASSYMLGPHGSSFIEMAQYLCGEKVEVEKATERPTTEDWRSVPLVDDPLCPQRR